MCLSPTFTVWRQCLRLLRYFETAFYTAWVMRLTLILNELPRVLFLVSIQSSKLVAPVWQFCTRKEWFASTVSGTPAGGSADHLFIDCFQMSPHFPLKTASCRGLRSTLLESYNLLFSRSRISKVTCGIELSHPQHSTTDEFHKSCGPLISTPRYRRCKLPGPANWTRFRRRVPAAFRR